MGDSALAFPDLTGTSDIDVPVSAVRLGSDAHKVLFCRTLFDTFNPYKPAVMDWPKLQAAERERLAALPIWDVAVRTEDKAGINIASYATTLADPLLKKAIALVGFEERRHRHVLSHLLQAYDIAVQSLPVTAPTNPAWAFMLTGYSECIDSFFAFGLFEIAKRSGFFPEELVETFEPVIHEESRHILFFINWAAWHRRNLNIIQRIWFELNVIAVWAFIFAQRISIAAGAGKGSRYSNFTFTGANQMGQPITARGLIDLCLSENERRMGQYDSRLVRPRFVPALARLLRKLLH